MAVLRQRPVPQFDTGALVGVTGGSAVVLGLKGSYRVLDVFWVDLDGCWVYELEAADRSVFVNEDEIEAW